MIKLLRKLHKCLKKGKNVVEFLIFYKTSKLSFFTNTKDKTPFFYQSSVLYKFVCPGCRPSYIGKTKMMLFE